jgi:ligand-binding SRPBCC domain-containing protein
MTYSFIFESKLTSSREKIWDWITSAKGISAEMWPYFKMTIPHGITNITNLKITLGQRLFRSYIFLFGFLPIDYDDMTLIELKNKVGFIEESPMGSMRLWRHERHIVDCPEDSSVLVLVDHITFEPRHFSHLIASFIFRVFQHRHRVLQKQLGFKL